MTDSFVAVPPDSTGKKLRTDYSLSSGGTVVHTEYVRADHSVIVSPTAGSFNVTVANPSGPGLRNVTSNTAASFNVTVSSARVDHSLIVSPTAGSFNVTVANPGGFRNVTSNTAASFLNTSLLPGYARVQSLTAASALVTAKSLSLTAGSFNATVFAPGYVRAQNPTTQGSFLVSHPGYVRVQNASYATFLAQVSNTLPLQVKTGTTFASFLVTNKAASGGIQVNNPTTYASMLVQVTNTLPLQVKTGTTFASFLVTDKAASGGLQVNNPTTFASFLAIVKNVSGGVQVSNPTTAASFLIGENIKVYSTAWPRASATGVYSFALGDTLGRNVSIANAPPGMTESTTVLIPSPNTAQAIFNAVAGMRHYITDLQAWNQSGTAVFLRFVSGIAGPVAAPTGKGMFFLRSTASNIAGMVDQDFLTPIFTNVGATFAVYGNLALSSTTRLRVFASGYQSPV